MSNFFFGIARLDLGDAWLMMNLDLFNKIHLKSINIEFRLTPCSVYCCLRRERVELLELVLAFQQDEIVHEFILFPALAVYSFFYEVEAMKFYF